MFQISVYRKPTSTGQYLNFHSFNPITHKVAVFSISVYRVSRLRSSEILFHLEDKAVLKSKLITFWHISCDKSWRTSSSCVSHVPHSVAIAVLEFLTRDDCLRRYPFRFDSVYSPYGFSVYPDKIRLLHTLTNALDQLTVIVL